MPILYAEIEKWVHEHLVCANKARQPTQQKQAQWPLPQQACLEYYAKLRRPTKNTTLAQCVLVWNKDLLEYYCQDVPKLQDKKIPKKFFLLSKPIFLPNL
jgi:hypothetical protein